MQNENKRALVVDLSYQVHRMLSVPSVSKLRTKSKVKVGGVFGVLKFLQSVLSKDYYTKVVCCMDSYPAFRKQLFPTYKSLRKNNPDSPYYKSFIEKDEWGWSQKSTQDFTFNTLKILLPKLKMKTLIQENVEGDDLVYHTCMELTKNGWSCTALSDDKDYLQLINLIPTLKICRVLKDDVVTRENFFEKVGVHNEWFIIYKALLGDPSDEIPSAAKGFGEASIKRFVNIAYERGINPNDISVYENLFSLAKELENSKEIRNIKNFNQSSFDVFRKNMKLMDFRECPYGENKREELKESLNQDSCLDIKFVSSLFRELEFNSLFEFPYSPLISRLT